MDSAQLSTDRYVSSQFLLDRFGITDRTLRTWISDPASGFPQPLSARGGPGLRHHLGEVLAWEKTRRRFTTKTPKAA